MKWYHIPHLLHALWWTIVAFGAAYLFFNEAGMDWRIDLITAIIFAPLIGIAVLVYRIMFRKKVLPEVDITDKVVSPSDPIQDARNKAR